jgi:Fur family ferric uptake transcriptional regulator
MTKPATHSLAPPADADDALQRIREQGGRITAGKRALAALLYSHRRPLTADQIVALLEGHDRSAIYRSLAQFEELGIAEHLHLGHGQAVYRPAGLPTVPIVCSSCGVTFNLDRAHTNAFTRQVAKHTGVALDLTHFPLTGTCSSCATPRESEANP